METLTLTQQIGAVLIVISLIGVYVAGWREIRRWF